MRGGLQDVRLAKPPGSKLLGRRNRSAGNGSTPAHEGEAKEPQSYRKALWSLPMRTSLLPEFQIHPAILLFYSQAARGTLCLLCLTIIARS